MHLPFSFQYFSKVVKIFLISINLPFKAVQARHDLLHKVKDHILQMKKELVQTDQVIIIIIITNFYKLL